MTQARVVKAALLVVLAACSGKAAEPAPAPNPPPAPAADPWTGSADVPKPTAPAGIVLEAPGAAPRAVVIYALPAYERTFTYEDKIATNGRDPMIVELTVAWACKPGGACTYQLAKFFMPGAPPDAAIETVAKSTKGEVTVQPDGNALIQPTTFMKTTPSIIELMKLSIVRMPSQPIGIGAVWHLDDDQAKRTFTLKALNATGFTVVADTTYADAGGTAHATLRFERGEPIARTLELAQTSTQDLGGGPPMTMTVSLTIQSPRE